MIDDEIAQRIEAFGAANGSGVGWYEDKGAYRLYLLETEAPIARLKAVGTRDEVRLGYWSHQRRWEDIDDMGGCVLPLIKPSNTSQTTASSGPRLDGKTYKV